ncbi:hypothetical protein PMAC_001270 [Pneumocystis sp. 'macacae']|nr:hypothetical protein PMAC_001270 [Pneumocystis sp. 'macacae']
MSLNGCILANYILQRSLGLQGNQYLTIPCLKVDVNTIDTPRRALRKEILLGTISSWPFYLVSVPKNRQNIPFFTHFFEDEIFFENITNENEYSRDVVSEETRNDSDIHFWSLSLGRPVQLEFKITFGPLSISNVPIALLTTIWDVERQTLVQVILRKHPWIPEEVESTGGGWVEVRKVRFKDFYAVSDIKSMAVPAGEESIYRNTCFSYLKHGLIPVLTNTRLIFFPYCYVNNWNDQILIEDRMWPLPSSFELEIWSNSSTQEPSPIVFELDLYIEKLLKDTNQGYSELYLSYFHTEFITSYKRKIDNSSPLDFKGVTIMAGGLGKTVLIITQLQIVPWERSVIPFHTRIWTLKNPVYRPIKVIQAGFSFLLGKKHQKHNCHQYCINNEYKLLYSYQNDGLNYSEGLNELHCEELGICLVNTGWC